MHANADCERLLRDRERDVVQLAAALRGADGKRVVALLAAHPLLIRYSDTTGKNILHVRVSYSVSTLFCERRQVRLRDCCAVFLQ